MSKNTKKVPKIRFPEFKDDWEHRKLNLIADRFDNLRIPVTESNRILGTTPYYGANGILDYVDGFTHDGEYVLIAEDGANDLNDYPVHYVNGKVWVNNHAHVIQAKEGISDNRFLQYSFKTFNIEPYLVGGSRAKLNANIMMDLIINTPEIEEQIQIGKFFKDLDNLITLHQRKLNNTKKLKAGLLQKMFPKKGELFPEIRFPEFTNAWEQRKLGDVGEFRSNGVDKKINKGDKQVNLLNYMDVYNRIKLENKNCDTLMQVTATEKQIGVNNIEENDVFFTPSSETADDIGRVMVVEETLENTVYSYHLMRFRPQKNIFYSIFPNYVFETISFRHQLIFAAQGVQRFVLNRGAFENLIVTIPNLEEQKLIGEFFSNLDNLITLHQRKLEHLQEQKKALLQQMFV